MPDSMTYDLGDPRSEDSQPERVLRFGSADEARRAKEEENAIERAHDIDVSMSSTTRMRWLYFLSLAIVLHSLVRHVPIWPCVLWAAGFLGFVLGRGRLTAQYSACSPAERIKRQEYWLCRMVLTAFSFGLAWGGAAWLGLWYAPLPWKFFWTFVVSMVAGMGSIQLSMRQLYPLLLGAYVPVIVGWSLWGEQMSLLMSVSLLLLALINLFVGQVMRKGNLERISLARRNELLAMTLAHRNAALEAVNRSKSELLAAASHDLRQPVHALGMLVNLMRAEDVESARKRLPAATVCVETLADMLTQLLDFNRLDLGIYSATLKPVSMHRLLVEVKESFGLTARRGGLELVITGEDGWVMSDPRLLRRIVFNLVSNAIRYTRVGRVSVEYVSAEGRAKLAVSDTGIGIAADQIDDIFLEYVRSAAERGDWDEGLGLGLSIVRKGISLLGHQIEVESVLGKGSKFTLDLGTPCEAPESKQKQESAAVAQLPKTVIAVLEDDPVILESLVDTIRAWGCVAIPGRGLPQIQDALAADGAKPTLILSDMHLSNAGDGISAIAKIRAQCGSPVLPAILLTGDLNPEVERSAKLNGIKLAYKPLHPRRLREMVSLAVQG